MDFEEFADALEQVPARLAQISYRGPLEQTARRVGRAVEGNFLRAEDSSGSPWPPHAPLTIALHGPHPLLRLTWTMHAAAINFDDPNAKRIITDRSVEFGVDGAAVPYARTQNEGAGRVPRREYFYVAPREQPAVDQVFIDEAERLIIGVLPDATIGNQ